MIVYHKWWRHLLAVSEDDVVGRTLEEDVYFQKLRITPVISVSITLSHGSLKHHFLSEIAFESRTLLDLIAQKSAPRAIKAMFYQGNPCDVIIWQRKIQYPCSGLLFFITVDL